MPHKLITRIAHAEISKRINRDLSTRELDDLEHAFNLVTAKAVDAARTRDDSRVEGSSFPMESSALCSGRA